MNRFRVSTLLAVLVLAVTVIGCAVAPPMDHFKVYDVRTFQPEADFTVLLDDQLETDPKEAHLVDLTHFANPTRKHYAGVQEGIKDSDRHFNGYRLQQQQPEPLRTVRYFNQFGQHSVDIRDPRLLLVPAEKTSAANSAFPRRLDHYKCYQIVQVNELPALPIVTLQDQFSIQANVQVGPPRFFCIPARKAREGEPPQGIVNVVDHLALYRIPPDGFGTSDLVTVDQFGERGLEVVRSVLLAVPTEKQSVDPRPE